MIRYRVAIRRNSDDQVRVTRWSDSYWTGPSFEGQTLENFLEFLWTEGNMGCDCNRHGEFERVADSDAGNLAMEYPCGDTEYSLEWIEIEGRGKI